MRIIMLFMTLALIAVCIVNAIALKDTGWWVAALGWFCVLLCRIDMLLPYITKE